MEIFKNGQLILAWRKYHKYAVAVRFAEFFDGEAKCYTPGERVNLKTEENIYEWFTFWCPFDIMKAETPIESWYEYITQEEHYRCLLKSN